MVAAAAAAVAVAAAADAAAAMRSRFANRRMKRHPASRHHHRETHCMHSQASSMNNKCKFKYSTNKSNALQMRLKQRCRRCHLRRSRSDRSTSHLRQHRMRRRQKHRRDACSRQYNCVGVYAGICLNARLESSMGRCAFGNGAQVCRCMARRMVFAGRCVGRRQQAAGR
jgi:hypothetical protein